jgi:hypothetical protein
VTATAHGLTLINFQGIGQGKVRNSSEMLLTGLTPSSQLAEVKFEGCEDIEFEDLKITVYTYRQLRARSET